MRKIISERNRLIAQRFQKGVTQEELAKEFDIGITYIRTILKECGLIKKKPHQSLVRRNNRILQMFKAGATPISIAESMNLTVTRIRQVLPSDYRKTNEDKGLLEAKEK